MMGVMGERKEGVEEREGKGREGKGGKEFEKLEGSSESAVEFENR